MSTATPITPPPPEPAAPLDWDALNRLNAYNAAVKKATDGAPLSQKELDAIRDYEGRGAEPAKTSNAPTFAEIASFYGTSEMTIRRCEELAKLPDVGSAPPWSDPAALAVWYRANYRSDVSKPPTRRDKLPRWLTDAQGKKPAFATPEPASPAAPAVPSEPARLLSHEEMILVARRVVAEAKAAMDRAPGDASKGAAFMQSLKELQMHEDRARKTGMDDMVPKTAVCTAIDVLLSRIPTSLELDLTHAFPEFARIFRDSDVEAQQKAWAETSRHFIKLSLDRLIASRFADRLTAA